MACTAMDELEKSEGLTNRHNYIASTKVMMKPPAFFAGVLKATLRRLKLALIFVLVSIAADIWRNETNMHVNWGCTCGLYSLVLVTS